MTEPAGRGQSVELARDELSLHLAIDGASVWTQDGRPVEIVLGKAPESAAATAPFTSYGRLVGSRLYLWGDDGGKKPRYGTLFALYGFLEEVGGFRWPRPGDKAIRSAGRKRIVVPKAWTYSYAPPLMFTRLRNPKVDFLIERSRQRDPKHPLTVADAERIRAENERWFLRMRHQTKEKVPHGHAFTTWQDRFLKAHPDWFALGKDGKRGNPAKRADRVKLCLSNPAVVAAIVEEWKGQGAGKYLNVAPNDSAGYCRCESCVKMAKSLSDRYVLFWNKIAEAARKVRPDVKIVTYLYSDYRLPPEKAGFAFPESMICGIVPHLDDDPKAYLSGWKKAGLKSFFFRPNYLGPKTLEPLRLERRVYDDLRLYLKSGMIGADYDAHTGDPAVARELYVAARLLAFPDLTFDQLMRELSAP